MLLRLLQALAAYFATDDDPTPGDAVTPATVPSRDNERFFRLLARSVVELAKTTRDMNQQVQQNTSDIQTIKTRLGQ